MVVDIDTGTELEMENESIAIVRCARCHERIGRVQVRAPAEGEDPRVWCDEVRGELEVLSREHDLLCPNPPPREVEEVETFGDEIHYEKP